MARALYVGHWMEGTGLTRVMSSIIEGSPEDVNIDFIALGLVGESREWNESVEIIPAESSLSEDQKGHFRLQEKLFETSYDYLFLSTELWDVDSYLHIITAAQPNARVIAYIPLDGKIIDPAMVRPLESLSVCVVYHQEAKEQLAECFKALGRTPPRIEIIPHGVDKELFMPTTELVSEKYSRESRTTSKQLIFPDLDSPDTSFVVLNANQDSDRKRLDLTIHGFALFADGKPSSVKLCLHQATSFLKENETLGAQQLIADLGIEERVYLNPLNEKKLSLKHQTAVSVLSDADLALLYQACDVGINTSMAEGWGLISFEHAACGAAQISPHFTTSHCPWSEFSLTLDVGDPKLTPYSPLAFEETTAEEVRLKLEMLYLDETRLRETAKKCCEFVHKCVPDWKDVSQLWKMLFLEMLGPHSRS